MYHSLVLVSTLPIVSSVRHRSPSVAPALKPSTMVHTLQLGFRQHLQLPTTSKPLSYLQLHKCTCSSLTLVPASAFSSTLCTGLTQFAVYLSVAGSDSSAVAMHLPAGANDVLTYLWSVALVLNSIGRARRFSPSPVVPWVTLAPTLVHWHLHKSFHYVYSNF